MSEYGYGGSFTGGNQVSDIGWAVAQLQAGSKVARAGWNGKGMWLWLDVPSADSAGPDGLPWQPTVMMKTAQDTHVAWLCSQSDLLATDWEIVR